MKLIYQSLMRSFPFIASLLVGITFCLVWISIVMVKVYKDDDYYCDNAYKSAKTKQECLEWGGDWVKEPLNFSSYLDVTFLFMSFCSLEDLTTQMVKAMDLNGKDNTPQYNANQHIQIFFILLYFFVTIVALNFFVSTILLNYKRIKEELSDEKHLTAPQRYWLRIKAYILSL